MLKIIDVSEFNGTIDWRRVAVSGVDGAVIRVGYRGWGTPNIVPDRLVEQNLSGASSAGIAIGLYIITQAVTENEAREEADFCAKFMRKYDITLPICWDSEPAGGANGRGRGDLISRAVRTKCASAFADRVIQHGGVPALYCSNSWYSTHVDGQALREAGMLAWISSYPAYRGAPDVAPTHAWDGWQYTPYGAVEGIQTDCDVSYFNAKEVTNMGKYYTDTDSHWARKDIDRMRDEGLMNGKTSTEFYPDDSITRAEVATVISRFMDWVEKRS